MGVVYVAEHHNQVLDLWRAHEALSLCVVHLDFHCDMRGLLIDRTAGCAYRICDISPGIDQGNFLTHAVLESRVRSLRWVFSEGGGRQHDVGTVKYESDLTALPYRWLLRLRGACGMPIQYEAMEYADWTGMIEGEHLDIDWDFFACREYPVSTIHGRVDAFLGRQFKTVPEQAYVCYSPDFSHPSRVQFQNFVSELAKLFEAEVIELPHMQDRSMASPFYKRYLPHALFRMTRLAYYSIVLRLRKRGIY